MLREIERDGVIPANALAADTLMTKIREQAPIFEISRVVKLSPALTANILKLSNSASIGGKGITSIEEAVFLLGSEELSKLALAIGTMDRVAHLKVKVDWKVYWLHCLLTARITEALAGGFRTITGKEYMSGLLHDIGKLFIEHNFPSEFEAALLRSMERNISFYEAELQLFDSNHAEIGAELCSKWHLNDEIVRAVRYHHNPLSGQNRDIMDVEHEKFLATCVFIANTLTNMFKVDIQGIKNFETKDLEQLDEWAYLAHIPRKRAIDIDFARELKKAEETIQTLENPKPSI